MNKRTNNEIRYGHLVTERNAHILAGNLAHAAALAPELDRLEAAIRIRRDSAADDARFGLVVAAVAPRANHCYPSQRRVLAESIAEALDIEAGIDRTITEWCDSVVQVYETPRY